MTKEDIAHLEQETRGQGGNDTWIASRKFRLTASNFGMVIKGINNAKAIPESVFKTLLGKYRFHEVALRAHFL